jgi:hypothetical protein
MFAQDVQHTRTGGLPEFVLALARQPNGMDEEIEDMND